MNEFLSKQSLNITGEIRLGGVPYRPFWTLNLVLHRFATIGNVLGRVIKNKTDFGVRSRVLHSTSTADPQLVPLLFGFPLVFDLGCTALIEPIVFRTHLQLVIFRIKT